MITQEGTKRLEGMLIFEDTLQGCDLVSRRV